MGEILTFTPARSAPRLTIVTDNDTPRATQAETERWLARQMSEAMSSLAIAGADIAEAQKLFLQQGTEPKTMISADTIESIVLALVPTIHLCGMTNRDRALYAALLHWLHGYQGGDRAG
ncbi:hypothetical protein [Rhizobium tropici]|uniref:Uncharacterized protein n=1 Tax=Rhizobium tropici TaxID=398 RepID=A0A329YGW2_RHITR|nr:hypothetical protein [Rhizobium tropici]RAX42433.1 hypothetical protein DQ393_06230 [Rhizobium tropici]